MVFTKSNVRAISLVSEARISKSNPIENDAFSFVISGHDIYLAKGGSFHIKSGAM